MLAIVQDMMARAAVPISGRGQWFYVLLGGYEDRCRGGRLSPSLYWSLMGGGFAQNIFDFGAFVGLQLPRAGEQIC